MEDDGRETNPGLGAEVVGPSVSTPNEGEPQMSSSSSSSGGSSSSSGSSRASGSDQQGTGHSGEEEDEGDDMIAMLEAEMYAQEGEDGAEAPQQAEQPAVASAQTVPPAAAAPQPAAPTGGAGKRRRVMGRNVSGASGSGGANGGGHAAAGCTHPAFFMGMCVSCGAAKPKDGQEEQQEESAVSLKYIHAGLEISKDYADRLRDEKSQSLMSKKKLLLVLDLDHTLLNSSRDIHLADCKAEVEEWEKHDAAAGPESKSLYNLPHMRMWTKLRPMVKEFLDATHELFELYIYTMGNRDYALQMASVLDPARKYFDQRIISQGDSTAKHTKSLDIVMGCESKVLILDDTEAVWPTHKPNLVRIERYLFFPSAPGHFGLSCPCLMSLKRDEDATAGALANTLRVFKEVHRMYFEAKGEEQDVRVALETIKRRVLEGCSLVLSRAFHESHPLWKLAQELGATCSRDVHKEATHVIAGSMGTDKTRWAAKNRVFVVNPRWIEASSHLWTRADEEKFKVTDDGQYTKPPTVEEEMKLAMAAAAGGG